MTVDVQFTDKQGNRSICFEELEKGDKVPDYWFDNPKAYLKVQIIPEDD